MSRQAAVAWGHILGVTGCVAIALGLFGYGWVVLGTLWSVLRALVNAPEPGQESYLGDGLYVSHDGFQVQLRAEGESHMNRVFLEPAVLKAFESWLKRLRQ